MSDSMAYYHVENPLPEVRHCPMCKGKGEEESYALVKPPCPFCNGTGHLASWPTVTVTFTTGGTNPKEEK